MVILFDIDGTLIDHNQAEAIAVAALRCRLGVTEHGSMFLDRWRTAFERHYLRYLAGELSIQDQRRERFREVVDRTLSDAAADDLSTAYIDDYLSACRLYSDVEPALRRLSAYRMGIISNGERRQQQGKLVRTGIANYFGPLILSAECGLAKPAPGIFQLACCFNGRGPVPGRLCWGQARHRRRGGPKCGVARDMAQSLCSRRQA
jgi:putative hydrolase of the HAD superfamily